MKPIEAASAAQRSNATSGVYGDRLRFWFPVVLFVLVVGAYCWRRGDDWRWYELVWAVASLVQAAIRWPHVQANRVNRVRLQRVDRREQWLMFLVFLGLLCLPMLALATPWFDALNYRLPHWAPWVGTAMMVASLIYFHRAHADLGRHWSPSLEVHEEHRLVTQGVYARVRHPMYASIWIFALAQPLLVHNWLAGAFGVLAFGLLYALRVPREEALMLDVFGDDYRAYMQRTGRLWPRRPR
ncbi:MULTISPECIES: protein-S-isoprenylcysteine O-methyltransferase [Caldimonas]|uniref:protein-S-isoprenylcysteine O-methyltransferase n=1 Tax=Caldimonas TaxID=196013 RepID=UPI000382CFAB|nr:MULTISPECIES: protein-S-isoprenylcysteine O-methyltransferase [Caldimonas]